jgi:tRNA A37 threonylcarbamoyladenosine modification protein TsaB
MILIINTCPKEYFEIITSEKKGEHKTKKIAGKFNQAEKLVPAVAKIIDKTKAGTKGLRGLGVVAGPGGFTAVRIGVATANALAYSLKLPLVSLRADDFEDNADLVAKVYIKLAKSPKGKLVMPIYDREPNITMAKK